MRIAYLTSEYVSEKERGGLATYLGKITQIMVKHGHNTVVIVLSNKNEKIQYKPGIEVVRVKQYNTLNNSEYEVIKKNFINSWRLYKALERENDKLKIDIVQEANFRAVGFFRSYSIPTIVRVSSDSALLRNASKMHFDFNKALKEKNLIDKMELFCVKCADKAFAPSKIMADVVGQRAKVRLKVIETPYMFEEKKMDNSIYEQRLKGMKYLLMNSTLSNLKGTQTILDITAELMERYPRLYLVYAGNDYGVSLKNGRNQSVEKILAVQNKLYDGRVIYLGMLNQDYLFPIIKNAYACVLPSRIDNLPNSCIEAMALEQIVIGTYGASFEQLIVNKRSGLLFKRDSGKGLLNAIDYLMNLTEVERMRMKKAARHSVERLNPEIIYKQMICIYENTIKIKSGYIY